MSVTIKDVTREIEFTVYGDPVPQGSKRAVNHRSTGKVVLMDMAPARLRSYRQDIAASASQQMLGRKPFAEPVSVRVMFLMRRPKSHYGTGKNSAKLKSSAPVSPGGKPDIDKLVRAVLDGLTSVAFVDDSQVVVLVASKMYAEAGEVQTLVTVTVLTGQ